MAKRKNPAAVALGRKGGLVSGIKKGFAALSPERLAEIQAQALARRQAHTAKAKRRKAANK